MKAKKEANKQGKKAADGAADNNLPSELTESRWSVITFETRAASGLTYDEAVAELKKLAAEKVSGLCIITDEAAGRAADNQL